MASGWVGYTGLDGRGGFVNLSQAVRMDWVDDPRQGYTIITLPDGKQVIATQTPDQLLDELG